MVFERTGSKISTKKSFKSKYLESLPDQQLGNLPHVHIVLHDAKNLVAADFLGTSDPYVVFTIGKEKVRSSTIMKTLNPTYDDEKFVLYVPPDVLEGKLPLQLSVYDYDKFTKDDYLGGAVVSLHTLPKDTPVKKTLKLDAASGEVTVTLTATNFGTEKEASSAPQEDLVISEDALHVVIEKLESSIYAKSFPTRGDLVKFASALSDVKLLKQTYLTTSWTETLKAAAKVVPKDDAEDGEENLESLVKHETDQLPTKIPVKLILVDQDRENKVKSNIRQFVSPILSQIDMMPRLGMFHGALVIGPWLIEWNNSSLCIPRKCLSKAAVFTADVDSIATISDLHKTIDTLAKVIVSWNASKFYKTSTETSSKLKKLDLSGPMKDFVEDLRKNGKSDLRYKPSEDVRTKFNISEKSISFKSHVELDKFVAGLLQKDLDFPLKHKAEYQFLKSLDRAMWMRHFKVRDMISKNKQKIVQIQNAVKMNKMHPQQGEALIEKLNLENEDVELGNKESCPLTRKVKVLDEEEEECACAFGDPVQSKSIIFN